MNPVIVALALLAPAQDPFVARDHYTKQEVMIPMRDGVKLYTAIYSPKNTDATYPILLQRTPYGSGPYGPTIRNSIGPSREFAKDGFIIVYQDVRGRYMSEGAHVYCVPHRPDKRTPQDVDESSDAYDTIDWLVKNVPSNNGRVGIWGVSQPGFYASHALIDAHPALKAVSPQAPVTDRWLGDDDHRNGAFTLAQRFSFMSSFGAQRPEPTPRSAPGFRMPSGTNLYDFFLKMGPLANSHQYMKDNLYWAETFQHPNYDSYWKARGVAQWLREVKPAVLVVGGWFDAEDLYGALHTFGAIDRQSPDTERYLVMGPWSHGQWGGDSGEKLGSVEFGSKTGEYFRDLQWRFFQHYLKGSDVEPLPKVTVFNTGANRWRTLEAWPPKEAAYQALYFCPDSTMRFTAPPAAANSYESDPANPVPYMDPIGSSVNRTFMVADQRFAEKRKDVLTFTSGLLDKPLTVAGTVVADLWVSTTGTDSDWIVKVIDVFPDDAEGAMAGYQMLVRSEVMRGRYRESFELPEPFVPEKPTHMSFPMQDILHTFLPGHQLMVQVQSSWFPLIDRNPQKFVNIYTARAEDFQKTTQRIFQGGTTASRIDLPVLPE
ncbi:MAG: CocE/NonD family hydrolase [Fimbriimonadaceae bacterium]|nr:CocE/NonD family hydrolase [Fimbriimonadaceae bacterium]